MLVNKWQLSSNLISDYLYKNNEWELYIFGLDSGGRKNTQRLSKIKHIICNIIYFDEEFCFDVIGGQDFYSTDDYNFAVTDGNFNIFYCQEGKEEIVKQMIEEEKARLENKIIQKNINKRLESFLSESKVF